MSRRIGLLLGAGALLIAAAGFVLRPLLTPPAMPVLDVGKDFPARADTEDSAGLCPWRNPKDDIIRFFPAAGQAAFARDETLILTRQRALVGKLLGRTPTGQENALVLHRIYADPGSLTTGGQPKPTPAGTVLTRFVRGESGVIELVLAVDAQERVAGARLQRLREPERAAQELQSARFLNTFRGKTYQSDWKLNASKAGISPDAQISARAALEEARTALILLHGGEQALGTAQKSTPPNAVRR